MTLLAGDHAHLDNARVNADVDGSFHVQVEVVNGRGAEIAAEVSLALRDAEGGLLAQTRAHTTVPPAGSSGLELAGVAAEAVPWCPEHPVVYTARLELRVAGQLLDAVEISCGFRRIAVRDGQLLLNDTPMVLRGFNRHEDSPRAGMRVNLETARDDFLAMKAVGANFVRLCHYPHHPGELNLCDALGLLVMCEVPVYWWTGLDEGEAQYAHKVTAAKRRARHPDCPRRQPPLHHLLEREQRDP